MNLAGKRCLITGAASGIGAATARAAAGKGARLLLTDIREAELAAVAEELASSVDLAQPADVADYDAVGELAAAAGDPVDVVMNVAGISTWGAVETLEHSHWRRTVDIDLMGPIHVIEHFVPPMIEAGRGGHLVNVSSVAGFFGFPWHAPYSAAKFGLRGVSEVLRFDLARHGIGVSLVCPGAVRTPLVGTVDIVGIDRDHPTLKKLTGRFERHAVEPEVVADLICDAVERERYLVFTSRDIKVATWIQRICPPLYERAMRFANDQFVKAANQARLPEPK